MVIEKNPPFSLFAAPSPLFMNTLFSSQVFVLSLTLPVVSVIHTP